MEKYLIKKHQIEEMAGTSKTHFLNPSAQRLNKSLGDATGLTGFGFHLIEIQPGYESTETHRHYHEDECVYVLSGEGQAIIGEESFAISAGDFIGYRAGGLPHNMINTGNEVLKCIVVGSRLDHDVADYTVLNKRIFRNKGMDWGLIDIDTIQPIDASVGKK